MSSAKDTLTLSDIHRIRKELKKCALKSYKGYFGMDKNGFFEIKTEDKFKELKRRERELFI